MYQKSQRRHVRIAIARLVADAHHLAVHRARQLLFEPGAQAEQLRLRQARVRHSALAHNKRRTRSKLAQGLQRGSGRHSSRSPVMLTFRFTLM